MTIPRLILLGAAIVSSAWAEKPPGDRVVSAECQMIVVPAKQALQLVPALFDEGTRAATWAQILEKVAKGEASLVAQLVARGLMGEKITSASVEEVRYATEFNPPAVPDTFFDPQRPPANEALVLQMLKSWPFIGVQPTAFEVRNTGQTMDLDLAEGEQRGVVRCHYTVQDVALKHFDKYDSGHLANGERVEVQQPRFTAMKTEGTGLFEAGKPALLAVHRLPGDTSKVELVFLILRFATAKAP